MPEPDVTYILKLCYDGTNYYGWQKQPDVPTVQGVLEENLRKLFSFRSLRTVGASRTDRGVHAEGQVASFAAPMKYEADDLAKRLNKMLPDDIAVVESRVSSGRFNARFDAKAKLYRYTILLQKNPLLMRYGWWLKSLKSSSISSLLEALNEMARNITGSHDFSAFSVVRDLPENPLCDIYDARWEVVDSTLRFEIRGNRFLHKMVRSLVGGMVDALLGKLDADEFTLMINTGKRTAEYITAPSRGLTLVEVEY